MLREDSPCAALPILSVLARPQDLGGSKLTLSSLKNQTLGLVANPQWLEITGMAQCVPPICPCSLRLFGLSVLGFLTEMNGTTCSNFF